MGALLVLPLFFVAVYTGVDAWLWRAIWTAFVAIAFVFFGPAWMTVPVVLILGIAIRNSLPKGSKV